MSTPVQSTKTAPWHPIITKELMLNHLWSVTIHSGDDTHWVPNLYTTRAQARAIARELCDHLNRTGRSPQR